MVYDYVRRMYGVDPVPGHRVRFRSRQGVIVRPRTDDRYIHVIFDGEARRGQRPARIHPTDDVEYLGAAHVIADLTRLIELIEAKRAEVRKLPDTSDLDAWQAYLRSGREIIDGLVASEGAVYRPRVGDAGRLKLGGIQTSATSGDYGLLRNWIAAAARRRVELSRGGAS